MTDEEREKRQQDFLNKQNASKPTDNEVETTEKDGSKKDKKTEKKSLGENLSRLFELIKEQQAENVNIQNAVEEVENLYGRD